LKELHISQWTMTAFTKSTELNKSNGYKHIFIFIV